MRSTNCTTDLCEGADEDNCLAQMKISDQVVGKCAAVCTCLICVVRAETPLATFKCHLVCAVVSMVCAAASAGRKRWGRNQDKDKRGKREWRQGIKGLVACSCTSTLNSGPHSNDIRAPVAVFLWSSGQRTIKHAPVEISNRSICAVVPASGTYRPVRYRPD